MLKTPLRIPEDVLVELWRVIEKEHPEKAKKIRDVLVHFKHPEWSDENQMEEKIETYAQEHVGELENSFRYALAHLFAFGDMNFDGNYCLNPNGFASIGGHQEKFFNEVRNLVFDFADLFQELCKGQTFFLRDNAQIIVDELENAPPSYSGATRGNSKRRELDEVTYENHRVLDYYLDRSRLQSDMDYIYQHVPKDVYEKFWLGYEKRYMDLKTRYQEAYKVTLN